MMFDTHQRVACENTLRLSSAVVAACTDLKHAVPLVMAVDPRTMMFDRTRPLPPERSVVRGHSSAWIFFYAFAVGFEPNVSLLM